MSSTFYGTGSRGQQTQQRCPDLSHPIHLLQLLRGSPRRSSRGRHLILMPKPAQLTPLNVEEQWLYSELLPKGRGPHPIFKGVPSHPAEDAHFSRLYPGSRSFGLNPKFMAIGEGRN
ncbi:hypothetical protein GOODEAATRI_022916 [Goodea atripinnis]|uniref:Uncharacterized protein n=1 Tax=Goodea atripinnis TaxID=208336 RepID=A0ABV0MK52_9TELE